MSEALSERPADCEHGVTDYRLSSRDANELKGVVLMPYELRVQLLNKYRLERGSRALVDLFAEFVGLANSVVENMKDALWAFGICEAKMTDKQAQDFNVPTIFGALNGVELANKVDQSKTCQGCAFRHGTLANQSPSTTCDAQWCVDGGEERFFCHEHLDAEGNPTVPCGGHVQILKRQGK